MDEPPSQLLKSRIPRKTIVADPNPDPTKGYWESRIRDAHCPLRKGTIYYHRHGTIFEHNIHSSGKHEPRIIVPKHPSRRLRKFSFVPIKGNRILLFARYSTIERRTVKEYLHLSIHEIRSDHRVGPALWSFNGSVDGRFDIRHLELIKSTKNELGITFRVLYGDHFKLFDVSTTETDASRNFPLIESGRIDFDLKLKLKPEEDENLVILSPDTHILLNVDTAFRHNETIDIHYLDSGGTRFSFITRLSIPVAETRSSPESAFSADGSKFAMAMAHDGVFVWDIRSKVPLWTFAEISSGYLVRLQFSSGNLGKEILVFLECASDSEIIHVIDATSFETEERLILKNEHDYWSSLFFDPRGGTLYGQLNGTIYEWDLRKNEPGPEWWIGEE